jgi:hypothetical protein
MNTTSLAIQLLAIGASLAYLCTIIIALRRSRMAVRQAVLWIISGGFFLGISIFPQPLIWTARGLGFQVPTNAAFVVWLLALTGLMFYQSLTTSRQMTQVKTLCQELAVLQAELEQRAED